MWETTDSTRDTASTSLFEDVRQVSTSGTGGWNRESVPDTCTYKASGALRERCIRRLGAAEDATVTITETRHYGGYSEWTQENSTDFTIATEDRSVRFFPDGTSTSWSEDFALGDSVFGRFDTWLKAAEAPLELLASWVELTPFEESASGRVKRYRVRPDSLLFSRLRLEGYGLTDAYIQQAGSECILIRITPAYGFREAHRHELREVEGSLTDAARQIVEDLTDRFMLGQERL